MILWVGADEEVEDRKQVAVTTTATIAADVVTENLTVTSKEWTAKSKTCLSVSQLRDMHLKAKDLKVSVPKLYLTEGTALGDTDSEV